MAGRGRPKSDDAAVLREIKVSETRLKELQAYQRDIDTLYREVEVAKMKFNDAVSSAAEVTKLSKGYLKKTFAGKRDNAKTAILEEAETIVEGIELLERKAGSSMSDSEGADESF